MKKKITIILLLGIVFLPISVFGYDTEFTCTINGATWKCGGKESGHSWSTADILGEAKGAATFTGELKIPSTVNDGTNTYIVNSIVQGVFDNYTGITKVEFPTNRQLYVDAAFRNCIGLKGELIIPTGYYLDVGTFDGCSNIEYITMGQRLHWDANAPFKGCTNVRYIDTRAATTRYGWQAWSKWSLWRNGEPHVSLCI